ncbi:hypothetical protein CKF94_20405 [Vibrio coralliilyticus]|uniref:DUF2391 family protein n=1 Tax=Vibrio coralliilyticus TaxID=190893 RepID=UPI000BAAA990|nr:DUF2391 family protein [Vibrio coralliilyticus]MCC2524223.1 DUF2391 family protein [Vibrio coralliilyticus]PAU36433.1 hypothetical protein CKF94_20405 [Vibrio coralliilyticus]
MSLNFNAQDASQIFVGAFALAVPIAFSEEAWRLGETLPSAKLWWLFVLSMVFLALYTYESVFQRDIAQRRAVFVFRIITAYVMAACVVAIVLYCLDKLPVLEQPWVAFKRVIVITMPASMGAIVVDSFDKE